MGKLEQQRQRRRHLKPDVSRASPPRATGVALKDSGAAARRRSAPGEGGCMGESACAACLPRRPAKGALAGCDGAPCRTDLARTASISLLRDKWSGKQSSSPFLAPLGRPSLGRSAPLPHPSYRTEGCGGQNRIKSHVACPRHAASRPAFQPKCKERSDCLWESPGLVTDMASPTALAAAAAAAAAAAVAPAAVAPSPWSPRGRAAAATAAFASAAARRAPRRRAQRCP